MSESQNQSLWEAVEEGKVDEVRRLIEEGANAKFSKRRLNLLFLAMGSGGNVEIIDLLLKAGAEVNFRGDDDATAVLGAVELGSTEILKLLIDAGADFKATAGGGMTALRLAAMTGKNDMVEMLVKAGAFNNDHLVLPMIIHNKGSPDVIKLILDAGADVHQVDREGGSPLSMAVEAGNVEVIQLLLQAGANPNPTDGNPLLVTGVMFGTSEVVNALLDAGAEVNAAASNGTTALMIAAGNGRMDMVKLLVEKGGNTTAVDENGLSALAYSAQQGDMDIFSLLLACHNAVPVKPIVALTMALMLAAQNGRLEQCKLLLQAGADVKAVAGSSPYGHISSCVGYSALMFAADNGTSPELITLLLDAGSDVNASSTGYYRETALTLAAKVGQPALVDLLLKAGADFTFFTEQHSDALIVATASGSLECVQLLVEAGASVATTNSQGVTALLLAAAMGALDTVRLLVKAGADVNARRIVADNVDRDSQCVVQEGLNVLMLAAKNGHTEMVQILLSAGAQITTSSAVSGTALKLAADNGHVETVKLLLTAGDFYDVIDGLPTVAPLFTQTSLRSFKEALCSLEFLTHSVLQKNNHDLWTQLIQVSDIAGIEDLIRSLVTAHPELALARDAKGRLGVDIATPSIKFTINSVTLWFGKYRPATGKPEHTSSTCFVFKAMDESGEEPVPVALKLMRVKAQFLRETEMRKFGFDGDFVMTQSAYYPNRPLTESDPDLVAVMTSEESAGVLTKAVAERLYCVVMPLADRNMFVAMKQERFAGKEDVSEVVTIFTQLVKCVMHMHSKGVLHGDIKPMNLVRMGGKWILIDLDACCVLGTDAVGFKSSSAYVPPESVFADAAKGVVAVKSETVCKDYGAAPLIAHESFDVWSLGCILYQMCSVGVLPLFAANQDDNLTNDADDTENSLWSLSAWSDKLKEKKLAKVTHLKARNLLSLMLSKDPLKRPTLSRVLGHPFLSGDNNGGRMAGEAAEFDVFISYRVSSDLKHAEKLYEMLTAAGLRVWWDKKCLESGKEWQKGFCQGLGSSTAFLCILSKAGTDTAFQSLHAESHCDNVLLEHRLALELKQIDYVHHVFPIMVGETSSLNDDDACEGLTAYHFSRCDNQSHIASVEEALCRYLDVLGLGTPLVHRPSVSDIVREIRACNGYFIGGKQGNSYENAVKGIVSTLQGVKQVTDAVGAAGATASKVVTTLRNTVKGTQDIDGAESDVRLERDQLRVKCEELQQRLIALEAQLKEKA